jgi:4-carboxymuconolactone decarboxylase
MAESELFERGLEIRREVLGTDYVDANLAGADEFMMGFQRLLTERAWATHGADQVWTGRQEAC